MVTIAFHSSCQETYLAKQKSTREIFTEEDIKAIKKSDLHAADIALILISCGCRPGELFTVPLVNCREDHFIGGSKTEAGKNRVIPIGPDGIKAYQKMRKRAIKEGGSLLIDGYEGQNKTAPNFTKRDWPKGHDTLQLPPHLHHQSHPLRYGTPRPGSHCRSR